MHFYCERLLVAIDQDEGSEGLNQQGVENLAGGSNPQPPVNSHSGPGQSTIRICGCYTNIIKQCCEIGIGVTSMASAGARAYNGDLGRSLWHGGGGPRSRAPGGGESLKPSEADGSLALEHACYCDLLKAGPKICRKSYCTVHTTVIMHVS